MFVSTTAVILQESIKCFASLMIILVQEGGVRGWLRHLNENIINQPLDCLKISVPSLVYTLQNNLIFVAVSNLDAATFQVSQNLTMSLPCCSNKLRFCCANEMGIFLVEMMDG